MLKPDYKLSAGGGAMVTGNMLTSNKVAPANESNFRITGDTLNYSMDFEDAYNNAEKALQMVHKGEMEGETIATVDQAQPLTFQDSYKRVALEIQTATTTTSYLTSGTILEFNIVAPSGRFIRPADMELVLPICFRQEQNGERIHLGQCIPVNNFFWHFLETIIISRKDDLKQIGMPKPSGSIATYMRGMLEDMPDDQLKFIEKDI